MEERFEVILLDEAFRFTKNLDTKTSEKIYENIRRAKIHTDPKFFKKLRNEIWEFRTLYMKIQYRLLAFWDTTEKENTLVLATHGFIKKTDKVPAKEIDKAIAIRNEYFKNKLK